MQSIYPRGTRIGAESQELLFLFSFLGISFNNQTGKEVNEDNIRGPKVSMLRDFKVPLLAKGGLQ